MRGRDAADYQDSGAADLAVDEAKIAKATRPEECPTCGGKGGASFEGVPGRGYGGLAECPDGWHGGGRSR